MKIVAVLSTILVVCLGIYTYSLFQSRASLDQRIQSVQADALRFSNDLAIAKLQVAEQNQASQQLKQTLDNRQGVLVTSSNQLAQSRSTLTQVQHDLESAAAQLRQRDQRILELESLQATLLTQAEEFKLRIADLERRISEAKSSLANTEGQRDALSYELARLENQHALLLQRFNDLDAVNHQADKLEGDPWLKEYFDALRPTKRDLAKRKLEVTADGSIALAPPPPPSAEPEPKP